MGERQPLPAYVRALLSSLSVYMCPSRGLIHNPNNPAAAIHGPAKGHPFLTWAREELKRVDFSGAQAVLVASVPGVHKGGAMGRYGHLRLRSLLEQEPIPAEVFLPPADTSAPWTGGIVCQFSSMVRADTKPSDLGWV